MNDNREPHPLGDGIAEVSGMGEHMVGRTNLPHLANGLDSFPEIRDGGFVYVDKTNYIAELFQSSRRVFCARPRRFGKSLMVSTIETLFSDDPKHRAMFEGLDIFPYLSTHEQVFRPRPVIRFDMNAVSVNEIISAAGNDTSETLKTFSAELLDYVHEVAKPYGILPIGKNPSTALRNFIAELSEKRGQVIFLVDEYDCPLAESMFHPEIQDGIRMIMRAFYMQIKKATERIFFAFLTGIAKFSNVGIFSEINNLYDISMDKKYAAMFGYTGKEIKTYFMKQIENIVGPDEKAKNDLITDMEEYYDGYTFDGRTHVYNPYTIELFLMTGEFKKYWVRTGSQSYIEKFIHEYKVKLEELNGQTIEDDAVASPRNVGMESDPRVLLYESGYMTIRNIPEDVNNYKLVYPNTEVRIAMSIMETNNYFDNVEEAYKARKDIIAAFLKKDCEGLINIFNTLFTNIFKSGKKVYEGGGSKDKGNLSRGHIKSFLSGANFIVQGEAPTNVGIADVVAVYNRKALVIEVKYIDLEPKSDHNDVVSQFTIESDCRKKLSQAISQIHGKNYDGLYEDSLPIAIVVDKSREGLISHAAYKKEAYRLDGKPYKFTLIGKVEYKNDNWTISYDSKITASKDTLLIAKSRTDTTSQKTDVKKTPTLDVESAVVASDAPRTSENNISSFELTLCKLVMPSRQYASLVIGVKEADDESLIGTLKRVAQILTKTQSASFWHTLSGEEKYKAFQDALGTKTSVMLSYLTQNGTFYLTAMDINRSETIGLLVTSTRQAAYGPYPLSRLLDDSSRLQSSFIQASLSRICKEQGVDETLPLPTPQQLLTWDEKN
ncbi:MAG: AAA family ATPase [Desulfovibrio sp.]|nr:AAA family ATPase [Desulfovibrio sp.]